MAVNHMPGCCCGGVGVCCAPAAANYNYLMTVPANTFDRCHTVGEYNPPCSTLNGLTFLLQFADFCRWQAVFPPPVPLCSDIFGSGPPVELSLNFLNSPFPGEFDTHCRWVLTFAFGFGLQWFWSLHVQKPWSAYGENITLSFEGGSGQFCVPSLPRPNIILVPDPV